MITNVYSERAELRCGNVRVNRAFQAHTMACFDSISSLAAVCCVENLEKNRVYHSFKLKIVSITKVSEGSEITTKREKESIRHRLHHLGVDVSTTHVIFSSEHS